MLRLLLVCSWFALLLVSQSFGAERISFSIHEAEPQIVSARSPSANGFSIYAREEVTRDAPPIAFSVYDAKPLVADRPEVKPDCTPARLTNRMLVIHPASETIKVKVCDANGCRFELRTVAPPIIGELKKLAPKWSCGEKDCDHFRLVNADDEKNVALLKELDVKRSDLPLLVKETDVEKRKKAAGMTGEELAKLWNKWFAEPVAEGPEAKAEAEKCLPTFGGLSGPRWDYNGSGSLRDHLTDIRGLHHLPRAVVDGWSDSQVQAWHNWHHEAMQGRVSRTTGTQKQNVAAGKKLGYRSGSNESTIANRAHQIATSIVRSPPAGLVAAQSSGDKSAQKKRSANSSNGSRTNGVA